MVEQVRSCHTTRPKDVDVPVEASLCKTADGVWTKWVIERLTQD